MRIALLSALAESAPAGPGDEPPALRGFAGKTVLAHQIDCAAHLGCTRVLCLTNDGPDYGFFVSYARRAGLACEIYDRLAPLCANVTAADEIVLIADGVLPDRLAAVGALSGRPGVLAFPAEPALAAGFERIDADRAWSGVLMARGDLLARLADLPDDCDFGSSLLRIALQTGVPMRLLDPALLANKGWQRRVAPGGDLDHERAWIGAQVELTPWLAPGRALAERLGLRLALGRLGHRWRRAPHFVGIASIAGALAAAMWSAPLAGLGLLILAHLALEAAGVRDRIDALGRPGTAKPTWLRFARLAADAVFVAVLGKAVVTVPGWIGPLLGFVFVALLHLGERRTASDWRAAFAERIALLALLLVSVAAGYASLAVAAAILIVLAAQLWDQPKPTNEITAD